MGENQDDLRVVPSGREFKMPGDKVEKEMEAHYMSAIHTPTEPRLSKDEIQKSRINFDLIAKEIEAISLFFESYLDNPKQFSEKVINKLEIYSKEKDYVGIIKQINTLFPTVNSVINDTNKVSVYQFLVEYKTFLCQFISDHYYKFQTTSYSFQKTLKIIEEFLKRNRAKYHLSILDIKSIIKNEEEKTNKTKSIIEAVEELEQEKAAKTQINPENVIELPFENEKSNQISINIAEIIFEACYKILLVLKNQIVIKPEEPSTDEKENGIQQVL